MVDKTKSRIIKEKEVEKITSALKEAKSAIMVTYSGMDVKSMQELKSRLKEANSKLYIVKNTLLKLAGAASGAPKETLVDEVLSGQTALIVSTQDPIAPLQVLGKFAKEFQVPQMKAGIVEGTFQDKDALAKLSTLPSKDLLLAQALGGIAAPLYGIVGILSSKMNELIYVLENAKGGE